MMDSRPAAETIAYNTCSCGCTSVGQCVLKVHLRDGVVVAVEPDDRVNRNVGREDAVLSEAEIIKARLQRRPCAKGLAFYRQLYHPDRITHPLKRAPGSRRGEGKYVRISWDEALTTVADKMKEIRAKWGNYSVIHPFQQLQAGQGLGRLFSLWGAGVDCWGYSSFDSIRLNAHLVAGAPGFQSEQYYSGSAADMLANAKLIVMWGFDPSMGSFGPGGQLFGWFVKLAREKGVSVIIVDPRYTVAAEVLADQWIPIKPGTDLAMFLAMANVLLTEDLWDRDFVSKNVEPNGFEKWQNYVLGVDDGVPKTPEWAETECAVPAETIRQIARLVANVKPAWLWCHWAVSRKSGGEASAKGFAALQALLGYWGTAGGGPPFNLGPMRSIPCQAPLGPPGAYRVPAMYRGHYWAQAVLLLDSVRGGEISKEDYMRRVGWRTDPSFLEDFHPRMVICGGGAGGNANNFLVTATDSPNEQIRALERMEFICFVHTTMTSTVKYADIILPSRDHAWEEKGIVKGGTGFECISYCAGAARPPGEAMPAAWIWLKLAERLGIDPKAYFRYYTSDERWERDWETFVKDSYQQIVDHFSKNGKRVPTWESFTAGNFINCDEFDCVPFTGWEEQVVKGKAFKTKSGKVEIYSEYVADESQRGKGQHLDAHGKIYELLPSDWGDLAAMPVYHAMVRGMADPLVKQYPLLLLSPHPRYRAHSAFWNNPWLRDHVYRHRVWMNVADAAARGIGDDDLVRVYNDRGTVVMPVYVTSRVMPGIVVIHHGGWYLPDSSGVDRGASPSTLLGGDSKSPVTPAKTTTLVAVQKYTGG